MDRSPCVLAVHGGAGTMRPERMGPDGPAPYHAGLRAALRAGWRVLDAGGAALDAVTAAVVALEDDPLFNAGRGAVFTAAGRQEMDAALMEGAAEDGRAAQAGAVAGVFGPRNPVLAARAVMEHSEHVLLVGEGAEAFCRAHGVAFSGPSHFHTPERWEALQAVLRARERGDGVDDFNRHGTVGAVALDRAGRLAAATSTGGMTGKLPGRVGDTPVFGAGTWADRVCAVSATGHGESFIRAAAAHEIAARMRLAGQGLEQAAGDVVAELAALGGDGGVVAVDRAGRVAMPFNTRGMYRGVVGPDGVARTAVWREEPRTDGDTG